MACYLGVDAGSTTLKAVVVADDGTALRWHCLPAGAGYRQDLALLLGELSRQAPPAAIAATGYGQALVTEAALCLSEISCHARGMHYLYPAVELLIDVGGQDVKVLRVGPGGRVLEFALNDKCAAGTGRFLDVMARALGSGLAELSALAAAAHKPAPISSMCAVFAESEVITLLAQGRSREDVAAGLLESIGERIAALARRLGLGEHCAMSGGGALQAGLVRAVATRLKQELYVPPRPQLVGALGAALAAREQAQAGSRAAGV